MIKFEFLGLQKVAKAIENQMNEIVKARSEENVQRLLAALIAATPIDTGYARSRWVKFDKSETATPKLKYLVLKRPLGIFNFNVVEFELSNDAPYIDELNKGHSKQAPSFFIEQTIIAEGFEIENKVVN